MLAQHHGDAGACFAVITKCLESKVHGESCGLLIVLRVVIVQNQNNLELP
jgi:hypothetical protein